MVAAHGPWGVLAPCLVSFFEELDRQWPQRDRRSDGSVGDLAHQARTSDHNPADDPTDRDPTKYVCAGDWDNEVDPAHGIDAWVIAQRIADRVLKGQEKRVKYIVSGPPNSMTDFIFSRTSSGTAPWAWRAKSSTDHHGHHGHLSVWNRPEVRNDTSLWLPPVVSAGKPAHQPFGDPDMLALVQGSNAHPLRVSDDRLRLEAWGCEPFDRTNPRVKTAYGIQTYTTDAPILGIARASANEVLVLKKDGKDGILRLGSGLKLA